MSPFLSEQQKSRGEEEEEEEDVVKDLIVCQRGRTEAGGGGGCLFSFLVEMTLKGASWRFSSFHVLARSL